MRRVVAALALALAVAAGGCRSGDAKAPDAPATMTVTSPAFADGRAIPAEFTCAGAGKAPPLHWTGVPPKAVELVLLVEDPDAPGGTFMHWARGAISPDSDGIPPAGGTDAQNSTGHAGWTPPCPPRGDKPHRYRFELYAIGRRAAIARSTTPADARAAIAGADPLARGVLEGRFGR